MSFPADPTLLKIAGGAIVSAFITVGGLSFANKSHNSTQDIRIEHLEQTTERVDELNDALSLTNQSIAVLIERIKNLKEKLDE